MQNGRSARGRRKVLIVGSGGREHALALTLLEAESVSEVIVTPGNTALLTRQAARQAGGRASGQVRKPLRTLEGSPLDIARTESVDLVVVGPEAPLCDGLVDKLSEHGFLAYGPSQKAARLEGSKAFMKDFAERYGIRTARHRVVRNGAELERAVGSFDKPPVVKADGLCAGKGVIVAESHDEAIAAGRQMLEGGRFGLAGATVVIEERLLGAEASVHGICDGERVLVLPAAQDHKRIGDRDTGPNTGGMGTYAPAPLVTAELMQRVEREIFARALSGMQRDQSPYRGTLFAGLMITPDGEPVLLEFNVRFGDPETQVLMNVVEGDLCETLVAAARGELDQALLRASGQHAVCVVLAAAGYPGEARTGDTIGGLADAEAVEGVRIYHAGTRVEGDRVVTAGGRVLGVTGRGSTLFEAHARAYRAAELIRFAGKQMRGDIARRALEDA